MRLLLVRLVCVLLVRLDDAITLDAHRPVNQQKGNHKIRSSSCTARARLCSAQRKGAGRNGAGACCNSESLLKMCSQISTTRKEERNLEEESGLKLGVIKSAQRTPRARLHRASCDTAPGLSLC